MKHSDFSFFSLGGIGEIGLNCYIMTIYGESFIIDMGIDFPENGFASIGLILPDISLLDNTGLNLKGIIFTHGHDDHIGAFPYYSERFDLPVYASPFAAELIKHKLKEMGKPAIKNLTYIRSDNKTIKIGNTFFNFFETKHSIPQSYGFYVNTDFGDIVFTSDFKDLPELDAIPHSPFVLFTDSTNAESDTDVKEDDVDKTIRHIFSNATGAIIATTFSSHIERINKLMQLANEFEKELFIIGKNIENTVSIAKKLGIIKIPPVNHWENINKVPRNKIVVITTGSQGERFSSLSLISKGTYRGFDIQKGDTIIVSSSIIPGNELNIYNMINRFAEKDIDVFYAKTSKIHTTGHGSRVALRRIIKRLRPKHLVPIHGEARHLKSLKNLAIETGYEEKQIFMLKNGDVLERADNTLRIRDSLELNRIFLDDEGGYRLDKKLIKERRKMAENGVIFALVNIKDYFNVSIETLGLLTAEEKLVFEASVCQEIKQNIVPYYYKAEDYYASLKEAITQIIKAYTKKALSKKPVVKVEIMEGKCY